MLKEVPFKRQGLRTFLSCKSQKTKSAWLQWERKLTAGREGEPEEALLHDLWGSGTPSMRPQ